MPETIEATELPLLKIFGNDYRFEIPDYQRPYAWTTEQVSDLFDDLQHAIDENEKIFDDLQHAIDGNEKIQEIPPYFLGSIVIIKNPAEPLARIVDGQQRITTLTILFCVLRELSNPKNKNTIDKYVCEESDQFAGIKGDFRLKVRDRDSNFFKKNVQEKGALNKFLKDFPTNLPDSRQRMFENAKYLWEKLSKLDEKQRDNLTTFLVQRCYLVVVSASDQSSAYRVFAVMNSRGLDLSPTDILKAEIIGVMDEGSHSQNNKDWEDIEEGLGRDNFRDLFAHIRMIYMKTKARGTLNQEFYDGVLNRIKGKNFIEHVLSPFADAYEIVSRASYNRAEDTKKVVNLYLGHLRRLDNSDWIPPAMAFFKRNPNDTEKHIQFTQDLERLAYGMFIRRANINQRIRRYADVLRVIENGGELFEDTSPLQLSAQEKTEILQALDGPVYSLTRVYRPLLLRLDSLLAGAGASYEHPVISIEHVLPQNPREDSEWLKLFPDEEERAQWTHKLANLVLLSRRKNSQAQNYEFEVKKSIYFQGQGITPFALTTQVLEEPDWTPDVLERRQRDLIDLLKKEWRLG